MSPKDAQDNPAERERRIAERAYHRWQQRGSPEGSDLDDWLEAEKELSKAGGAQVQPSRK